MALKRPDVHTCDEAGDQQGQHEHLKHSHQQFSGEREELDFTVRHVVRPQGESQDYACSEHHMWQRSQNFVRTFQVFSVNMTRP